MSLYWRRGSSCGSARAASRASHPLALDTRGSLDLLPARRASCRVGRLCVLGDDAFELELLREVPQLARRSLVMLGTLHALGGGDALAARRRGDERAQPDHAGNVQHDLCGAGHHPGGKPRRAVGTDEFRHHGRSRASRRVQLQPTGPDRVDRRRQHAEDQRERPAAGHAAKL